MDCAITGRVDKLILILWPRTKKEKLLEFTSQNEFLAKLTEVDHHDALLSWSHEHHTERVSLTRYRRDDNGETEEEEGVWHRDEVGDPKKLVPCEAKCGGSVWANPTPDPHRLHMCDKCINRIMGMR